jgi:hypothetical protein
MAKLAMIFSAVFLLQLLTTRVTASTAQCFAIDQLQKSINSLQAQADKLKQSCCNQGTFFVLTSFLILIYGKRAGCVDGLRKLFTDYFSQEMIPAPKI